MPKTKIAITLDTVLLRHLDSLVGPRFKNRSQAIEACVSEKLERYGKTRLARECEKLDPAEERMWADLGLAEDAKSWPEY